MTRTSTALLFDGAGSEPYLAEVAVRAPGPGEVLVRLEAAGVCHSDLHVLKGEWPIWERVAMGHEGAGVVEQVGAGTTDLEAGDRVVLSWYAPCGSCTACREGKTWLCAGTGAVSHLLPDGSTPFTAPDGRPVNPYLGIAAFSEYTVVPRGAVVKIPDAVPSEVAALIGCSVATGIGAVTNTAQVEAGSTAVVIGAGGVGQAIIAGLKLVGARRIIVLDPSTERRSIATEFGATSVIDGRDPDRFDLVHSVTDGEGADYVFDAIGISTVTSDTLRYLKNGGAAVLVGMPAHDDQLTVDHWPLVYKGQRILGCNYGSSRPQVDFVKIAGLYLAGQLPLNDMVGERIRQADIPDAIRALSAASGKRAIVRFGSD